MLTTNPFSVLAETIPSIVMQGFVVLMVLLVVTGTLLDIIHKKNVKYFFENAKKAKKNATKELSTSERIAVVSKTIAYDIGTTSELGAGKRRVAHVLGMYGTILLGWICSHDICLFINKYRNPNYMAYDLAYWSFNDCLRWVMVLVFSKS